MGCPVFDDILHPGSEVVNIVKAFACFPDDQRTGRYTQVVHQRLDGIRQSVFQHPVYIGSEEVKRFFVPQIKGKPIFRGG